MVNEIKLDNINPYYAADNKMDINPKNKLSTDSTPQEAIAVTNHLNDLIKSCNSYDEPVNSTMLNDIKYRVQHNEYTVDFDKLSDKLLHSGVITLLGD